MTTKTFIFANNATTVLASGISAGSTSLTVESGTGAAFPHPIANQIFALSLNDALTGQVYEVIYCNTHASGSDTFSGLLRGQEGTTATTWAAGDTVAQWITAGQQGAMLQRIQLQGNLNLFVNGSTGSDSNTGLSSGQAFATWQFAWNFLQSNYDMNGFNATITQAGTNNDSLSANGYPLGATDAASITLVVNGTWSATNSTCLVAFNTALTVRGSGTLIATGTGLGQGVGIAAFAGATINYSGITFGRCPISQITSTQSAQVSCVGNYTISDNAGAHLTVSFGASIQMAFFTCHLTGTPAFSQAFVQASTCGTINAENMTFTGSATGIRYGGATNAVISTASGSINYFPGNAAGFAVTGAVYV